MGRCLQALGLEQRDYVDPGQRYGMYYVAIIYGSCCPPVPRGYRGGGGYRGYSPPVLPVPSPPHSIARGRTQSNIQCWFGSAAVWQNNCEL